MSAAMEIIKRANQENKGIVIIVSGKEMERRIPICVRIKNGTNNTIQETSHHNEELTLELDLNNGSRKVAYVCDKKHTKVKVSEFLFKDSVRTGKPSYSFLSAHVFMSLDEIETNPTISDVIPLIPEVEKNHFMSEW